MARWTREAKAAAVARVQVGESPEAVAEDIGAGNNTVRRWVMKAERQGTADEKKLAAEAGDIAERIKTKQAQARDALLDKLLELIPTAKNVRDVAWSYGVLTDKELLAAGKPTSIQGQAISLDSDLEADEAWKVADELRERREVRST